MGDVHVVTLGPVAGVARHVAAERAIYVWAARAFAVQTEPPGNAPRPPPRIDPALPLPTTGFELSVSPASVPVALLAAEGGPVVALRASEGVRRWPAAPRRIEDVEVAGVRMSWPPHVAAARVYEKGRAPFDVALKTVAVRVAGEFPEVMVLSFGLVATQATTTGDVGVAVALAATPDAGLTWPRRLTPPPTKRSQPLEGTVVLPEAPAPPPRRLDQTVAMAGDAPASVSAVAPFALAAPGSSPGGAPSPAPGAPWSPAPADAVPSPTAFEGTMALPPGHDVADEVAAARRALDELEAAAAERPVPRDADADRREVEPCEAERRERERVAAEREAARRAFAAEQEEARRREAERAASEAEAEQKRARRLMSSVYGGFKKR